MKKTNEKTAKKFQYEFWNPEKQKIVEGKFEGFFMGKFSPIIRVGNFYVNINYDLQRKLALIKDNLEVGKSKLRIVYKGKIDTGNINKMRTFDLFMNGKLIEYTGGFEPIDVSDLPF